MNLNVVAAGTRMPAWVAAGWAQYARRMPPHLPLQLIELDAGSKAGPLALAERAPHGSHLVALDGRGREWSTRDLSGNLDRWLHDGRPVSFLIGAADGHSDELLDACGQRWSLGRLTLPHMLVRVLVAEQLYRAHTILSGHPYHRG